MRRPAHGVVLAVALALSAGITSIASAAGGQRAARLIPLEHFLAEARIMQVVLSPEGDRLAYLLREVHGVSVWTLDIATRSRVKHVDSRLIEALAWSTSGGGLVFEAGQRLAYLPLNGHGERRATFVATLDPQREQRFRGVDPSRPDHLLITEKDDDGRHRLLRLDVAGTATTLLTSVQPIRRFVFDSQGRVSHVQGTDGSDVVIDRVAEDGGRTTILRCAFTVACRLLAWLSADSLLVEQRGQSPTQGGRWALARFDAQTATTTVLSDDPLAVADLDAVHLDPRTGRPLLAVYHSDARRHAALGDDVAPHLARIEASLPTRDLYLDPRDDSRFWLVVERGSRTHHARYFVYDTAKGILDDVLEDERASAMLPASAMVVRRAIRYTARDGFETHGFASVPRGIDLAHAPLVAKIHGGPWNHVRSGFDAMTQFLVNRGYVVFEPNFRGSTGFGLDLMLAARGQFGDGAVHQDIVDGVAHLTSQGIGNATRVAIMGHSFGGFSALGGVAFSPTIFRAALASAPAIDLVRAARDIEGAEGFLLELEIEQALNLLMVMPGDAAARKAGMVRLRQQSPEARLNDTARPVLILAGGRDEKVDIVDVKHYASALDSLGKDVSLLTDDDAGHSFEPRLLRRAHFALTERFLAAHIGGRVGPLDPVIEDYIRRHLRLESESLNAALALASR